MTSQAPTPTEEAAGTHEVPADSCVRIQPLDDAIKLGASDIIIPEKGPITYRTAKGLPKGRSVSSSEFAALAALTGACITDDNPEPIGAFEYAGARWRFIHYQNIRGKVFQLRHIPQRRFPIEQLRLPPEFLKLIVKERGIIFITGPTGSGKSTTLAATIDYLNRTVEKNIVTLEDPVEHVFQDDKCSILQQEHGTTFKRWDKALERLLRKDPDVIVFGELRAVEVIEAAITAAATGHLVLATLHTSDAPGTIIRLTDALKGHGADLLSKLADSLLGVLAQQLVPTIPAKGGPGRVPAYELLIKTDAVANIIRQATPQHIKNEINLGAGVGMVPMNRSLAALVKEGFITRHTAAAKSFDPKTLNLE